MIRFLMLAIPLLAASAWAHAASPLAPLAALQHRGARVSALVIRLNNDKVLAALNPDTALTPASTSKLYVAADALSHWGGDYRFRTRLLATGPVVNGIVQGNLVFAGAGDPAFTNETIAKLVRHLTERGIKEVKGDLVVNAGYFGKLECIPADRCTAAAASNNSYDAKLSSAAVNFANAGVAIRPGSQAGDAATVAQVPYPLPMFRLRNHVKTGRGRSWRANLSSATRDGDDILTATGTVPAGASPRRYYVSVSNPDRYTGELLRAFLAAAGIRVKGTVRVSWARPAAGREVAAVKGQPLWIQLRRMLVWSNNFMADTLALDLLRTRTAPPLSLTAAGAAITRFARGLEAQSPLMHNRKPQLFLASGSGLTADSRVSARDLVALLDVMYRRTGLLPSFLGSLTVPAHTPVGMLKDAGKQAWMRRIAVKTGSFPGDFKVFALAGYIRLPDDGWGAFAILINGTKKYEPSLQASMAATRAALTPFLKLTKPLRGQARS
ncbi:MAG: D-alanyl-D-alanine carboxypeptidase/D-alanyl-D-alanine endopeptidase [Gammaproteobacteria bacterium]